MTVSEAIANLSFTPSAAYTGIETADDFVFAIQTDASSQTKESAWIVCADHVKEHSGALNASTTSDTFIRTGPVDTKSAVQRTYHLGGDHRPHRLPAAGADQSDLVRLRQTGAAH